LDAGDYPGLFEAAVTEAERLGYPEELRHRGQQGRVRGLGVAAVLGKNGVGPQGAAGATGRSSGAVHAFSGGTSLGQGVETVLAQIAADALGADPASVSVTCGDTQRQPFGMGSWASRTTVVAGNAVHAAARAVRLRATQVAARMLEVAPDDLVVRDGRVGVRGDPGKSEPTGPSLPEANGRDTASVTLAQVARAAAPPSQY